MTRIARSLSLCVCVCLLGSSAWAQATAQLSGTVRDESGAVLPGVTVTANQTDTGFTRTVVTDETGAYVMTNLPTGPYRLEISLAGFRTYAQTGIVLQVGATPTINAVLAVGNLEETVAVEAAAPLVDVRSSGIAEVVENQRILELPLQGRNVTDLILLAGAATNMGNASGASNGRGLPGTLAVSVAGGLRSGVAYVLDGAMHNNPYDNLNLPFPFPDALQEFSVATSGLSAHNGTHSGASVNAVTKSGTNRFSGNAFEFLRDKRFNATSAFAAIGPNGKRKDDGLKRNQFGGTLGGPLVRDKLFFFGAYQGTLVRQTPADLIAYVPTAAMLSGDFSAVTSPACNAGRQVTLRAPFVNNRIDPALFSNAAVAIARKLPATTSPCGQITYSVPLDSNNSQTVARIDYQRSANHTIFGRYIDTIEHRLPTYSRTGNILTVQAVFGANKRQRAQTATIGDTRVFGSNTVNAFRLTGIRTGFHFNDPPDPFFDAPSLGIKLHTYVPGSLAVNVTNGFSFGGGVTVKLVADTNAFQIGDDVTMVRGRHELTLGGSASYWTLQSEDNAVAAGSFAFNGQATGLGLADFLTGQASQLRHGAPGVLPMNHKYIGVYGEDTWKASSRLTLNMGLRWEPYFGQNIENGSISNFLLDNFRKGVRSQRFTNAPPGLIYPGDPGFPPGLSGQNTQWRNLSPRAGIAWDVTGDGRTAVRSSYGLGYDFPSSQFMYIAASASPFSNRVTLAAVPFEDPYRNVPGGDTHPLPRNPPADALFPGFGAYGVMDPDINSTRVQSWNVTVERQFGTAWQGAVSYLGSYTDRLWGQTHINPSVFMGLGPCTINRVNYPSCTTTANTDQRRVLYLENPAVGQWLGPVVRYADVGTQTYSAMKLSFRRRAATGVSVTANYTISRCESDTAVTGGWLQFTEGYLKPDDPSFDRGNCVENQRHIMNFTVGAQTPVFGARLLRAIASDWRASGIMNARSGNWLNVTTGRDISGNGILGQRVNQVLADPYGDKTLNRYLNPAAFAYPAAGTFGNYRKNSIHGPGFWTVDVALSKLVSMASGHTLELRIETFNLLNNFNWGDPVTNLDAGTFGQITTQAGDPRIMQFGVKYGF